jgi:uncharacterized integral membrane protein
MKKNIAIYYILLLIGAIEAGRGIQMIFTEQFWDFMYPYARLSVLLQFVIGGVLLFIAHVLKPKEE